VERSSLSQIIITYVYTYRRNIYFNRIYTFSGFYKQVTYSSQKEKSYSSMLLENMLHFSFSKSLLAQNIILFSVAMLSV